MRNSLRVFVGVFLLAGCSKPTLTPEQLAERDERFKKNRVEAMREFVEASKRLESPLLECARFLETGSYDSANLIAAGFEEYDHSFRKGKGYRRPKSEEEILEVSMIEAETADESNRCSISTTAGNPLVALTENGFEVEKRKKGALASRGNLSLTLTGVYYRKERNPFYSSPHYYTVKRAEN